MHHHNAQNRVPATAEVSNRREKSSAKLALHGAAACIRRGEELGKSRSLIDDEIRNAIELLVERRGELIANADVQRQGGGGFPIVLNVAVGKSQRPLILANPPSPGRRPY